MSPLEKMARAVWNHRENRFPRMVMSSWEDGTALAKATVMDDLRVGLMAIREPDKTIMSGLWSAPWIDHGEPDFEQSWRLTIDAILNQEPRP